MDDQDKIALADKVTALLKEIDHPLYAEFAREHA